ncbi:hydroxyisourate hydrolase [Streptomyces sp. NBC_01218]|uniref:hydroxyisourate hydrolase n=1 Tax=unclassified Streptomyces TaxID=2593676 RepID=UPI0023B92078|nr:MULTISPECIES: hydroxyisourate hydrolase [unclassified Streptomyces]WEH43577.1 hydroxyisourate hydrolase [Streptomyces sp. AM 2-1-1]WSQ55219.1 hydroxyisourate hydrolase [Streptomyces sp. NBC_01218]
MSTDTTATVSTHVLDTSVGRPAASVPVRVSTRADATAGWTPLGGSLTDPDGRCADLPALPEDAAQVRLEFDTGAYSAQEKGSSAAGPMEGGAFFPEVAIVFTVRPGEHHHVPLLLSPFGYSVYRGS